MIFTQFNHLLSLVLKSIAHCTADMGAFFAKMATHLQLLFKVKEAISDKVTKTKLIEEIHSFLNDILLITVLLMVAKILAIKVCSLS